jgi:hypothetical protein
MFGPDYGSKNYYISGTASFNIVVFNHEGTLRMTSVSPTGYISPTVNQSYPYIDPYNIIHEGLSFQSVQITDDGKYIFATNGTNFYYSIVTLTPANVSAPFTCSPFTIVNNIAGFIHDPCYIYRFSVGRCKHEKYRIVFVLSRDDGTLLQNNMYWGDWDSSNSNSFTQIDIKNNQTFTNTGFACMSMALSPDNNIIVFSYYLGSSWKDGYFTYNNTENNYTIFTTIPDHSQLSAPTFIRMSISGTKIYKVCAIGYGQNTIYVTNIVMNIPMNRDALTICQENIMAASYSLNVHSRRDESQTAEMFSNYNLTEGMKSIREGFNAVPTLNNQPSANNPHTAVDYSDDDLLADMSDMERVRLSASQIAKVNAEFSGHTRPTVGSNGSVMYNSLLQAYDADVIIPSLKNANAYSANRESVYNKYFANNAAINKLNADWSNQPNNDAIDNSGNLYYKYDANNPSPNTRDVLLYDTKQSLVQYNTMYIMGTITAAVCVVAGIALGSSSS